MGEVMHDLSATAARRGQSHGAALVVLNSPSFGRAMLERLWAGAALHVCADGGANRLFDSSDASMRSSLVPHHIVGDLDSARPDVVDFYKALGSGLERAEDQDRNDLDKALDVVERCWAAAGTPAEMRSVAVLGAFGGRFDQEMACFNSLYRTHVNVRLYSDDNVAILLRPGAHRIRVDPRFEGPTCGLIPLGGRCDKVTTTGLRWNLSDEPLAFGELVSTSNAISFTGSEVTDVCITTSHPLVWSSSWRLS